MTDLRPTWFHFGPVFSLAIALSGTLAGCQPLGWTSCEYDGVEYSPGDAFPSKDGCNSCSCTEDGDVACTDMACISDCTWGGVTHAPGASFPAGDGCNSCFCIENGDVACTLVECTGGCTYDGLGYMPGDSFPASDGCNTCTCGADGSVACTERGCPEACTYGGVAYEQGDSFPSLDGCNTCTCTAGGGVACTERYCGCDPSSEWWRQYVSTSARECAVIDFACTGDLTYVSNECGCGCEQDPSCPPSFDCKPPKACDLDEIQRGCPYSTIQR
ncbi:hypothetical protein WME90_21145 [Sorangium sp. So ce375]|uniref:hypothetical protein n=1 Tax=Sorangium sp. So ce375 TaxID=3133306 RepID=UPI003F5AE1C6